MRKPTYISPTALKLFTENPEEYYLRYLADIKAPRDAQTQAMSIGSAFDAYVKSHIHTILFGGPATKGTEYELETLFEKQVESQHRKWAWIHGAQIFKMYTSSGALADLFLELNGAIGTPKFEFDLQGEVRSIDKTIAGVVLMGKPDLHFVNKENLGVIADWKVNGYVSKYPQSPKPGYVCIKPGFKMHNDCVRDRHRGMWINRATTLDKVDADWAAQLAIYSWLCGEEVGGGFVTAIDQIVCNTKNLTLQWPELRFAQHRLLISEEFQHRVFNNALDLWTRIQSGYFFTELSKQESDDRCEMLNLRAKQMWEPVETPEELAFRQLTTVPRTH